MKQGTFSLSQIPDPSRVRKTFKTEFEPFQLIEAAAG